MAVVSRERWMAVCFALGSTCFLVGPFPGYEQLVGASADAITFFVGSILFTAGGVLPGLRARHAERQPPAGRDAAARRRCPSVKSSHPERAMRPRVSTGQAGDVAQRGHTWPKP